MNYKSSIFIKYNAKVTFMKHSKLETGNMYHDVNVNQRATRDVMLSSTNNINS